MTCKFIVLTVTASLFFGVGCSKNRGWLSRNDYSEMQDPFMEPDSAAAKSSDRTSKTAGRASLASSDPALAEGRARVPGPAMPSDGMAGPKPIRQAGASNDITESGRRVSAATYPEDDAEVTPGADGAKTKKTTGVTSYSGPALSDFLQKRKAAARDAATQVEELPARAVSSASAAVQNSPNPAATRAALPTISPEAESFSNFLTNKSNSVANTAQKPAQQVQGTSTDVNNFASWAEQQKAEWSNSANTARSTVSNAPAQTKKKAGSVFQQARQASQEMADSVLAPEFDDAGSDTAMSLIKQPGSASDSVVPVLSKAKMPAANHFTADENPFSDSFEEPRDSRSTAGAGTLQKPATSSVSARSNSTTSSLDESFRMDTGWKPAHMTRP